MVSTLDVIGLCAISNDEWVVGGIRTVVRGDILGFVKDEFLRKHLPRMYSLIKNES